MSQLQSLHLHIQTPVLTEQGLSFPTCQSSPLCFAPCAHVVAFPLPLELEAMPLSPGSLVLLALLCPEHLKLFQQNFCWI